MMRSVLNNRLSKRFTGLVFALGCLVLALFVPQVKFLMASEGYYIGYTSYTALNDTGIDWCADSNTNFLGCPVAGYLGQDGESGRDALARRGELDKVGRGRAGFDYTKIDANGNELPAEAVQWSCVRDNVTGAIWEVKTDDGGLRDKDWTYSWYDSDSPDGEPGTENGSDLCMFGHCGVCFADERCDTEKYVEDVNANGLCGFIDWRMPTPKELSGLIDYGRSFTPSIDTSFFPYTPSSSYWTSTFWSSLPNIADSDYAWVVAFNGGNVFVYDFGHKSFDHPVRLIRAEARFSSFLDNNDGTVTDTNTGLMWAQCSAGQRGADCGTGNPESMTWQDALVYAEEATLANYSGWRLPTIRELQSLVDYSTFNPAIDEQFFPATPSPFSWDTGFWSSSPSAGSADSAWFVNFYNGHAYDGEFGLGKNGNGYVRLVRSGQLIDLLLLTVTTSGNGSGSVTSNPPGIDCGSDCSEPYAPNTQVTLTATPATGSVFSAWSEPRCGTATNCTLTLDSAQHISAAFSATGEGDSCTATARTLTTPFTTGRHQFASETSITVAGTVQVGPNAELILAAPMIAFEPGFRIAAGARLNVRAAAVTCPTAVAEAAIDRTKTASRRQAGPATLAPVAPQLFTAAAALPTWIQAKLDAQRILRESITNVLLDQDDRWLLIETSQALQTSDQNATSDLYRLDLLTDQLQLISATEQGQAGNGPSRYPAADATGERIVFHSEANDLVPNDSNNVSDLFLRDLAFGQTIRLTDAEQASANPALDAIGERLVYDQATQAGPRQVVGQALAGGTAAEVLSLSTNDSGLQVDNHHPAISADGGFIAYLEHSAIRDEANPGCQVHLYDRDTEVYHRQPCPDALASASASEEASVRGVFSEGAQSLEWYLTGVAEPIRLSNPLALGTATQDDARR